MSGLDTHSQQESQLAITEKETVMSGLNTHSQQESQLAITEKETVMSGLDIHTFRTHSITNEDLGGWI